ncbi:hypothetical protein [Sediminibacillus albus]|uniref:Uncharacterized protein n=1 Tax=Sediminibacillus albus TaxID=407036 RepID=A0A1G8ZZX0_9BACI|nr:hypothetical protein [Sediminibacillus albus]SDK20658.1 hypothetical protein SAMN05216243_2324 [Sediminibacillus albus]
MRTRSRKREYIELILATILVLIITFVFDLPQFIIASLVIIIVINIIAIEIRQKRQ